MRTVLTILSAVALAVPVLRGQDGVEFDQRYVPGHRYHQVVSTDQEMQMDLEGDKKEQTMTMTLGLAAVAEPAAAGGEHVVTIAYDHAAMSQSAGGQKFSYDSKDLGAANAGPLAVLGAIINQPFRVVFDSGGKVKDVENFEATIRKLSGGDPATTQIYTQLFNKDTVMRMMEQSALRSPEGRPIKPGEAWPLANRLEMPGVGTLVLSGFYTYKGMVDHGGHKVAQVDAAADIRVLPGAAEEAGNPNLTTQMNLKIENGRMAGTFYYDPEIRFTREAEMKQEISLTAQIPDGTRRPVHLLMKQALKTQLDQYGDMKPQEPAAPAPPAGGKKGEDAEDDPAK